MKVIAGLGNPGPEYEKTRHNVGWWVLDRLNEAFDFGQFRREGQARVATGRVAGEAVRLIAPQTFMNRSGAALAPLRRMDNFDIPTDLLVVVDEVALEPGRMRLRAGGSAGGHNGLKSVQDSLGTQQYPRLRIGVGACPPGWDLADYVLSAPAKSEREAILELMPDIVEGIRVWIEKGTDAAANILNR